MEMNDIRIYAEALMGREWSLSSINQQRFRQDLDREPLQLRCLWSAMNASSTSALSKWVNMMQGIRDFNQAGRLIETSETWPFELKRRGFGELAWIGQDESAHDRRANREGPG